VYLKQSIFILKKSNVLNGLCSSLISFKSWMGSQRGNSSKASAWR